MIGNSSQNNWRARFRVGFHSILYTVSFFFILAGCNYGYDVLTKSTPISEKIYPPTSQVSEVHFKDDNFKITAPYDQIAFLEVQGTPTSTTTELLEDMKKKAASDGADAIINIEHHYIVRQHGEILSELVDPKNNAPEDYDTISLTGVAIKYR